MEITGTRIAGHRTMIPRLALVFAVIACVSAQAWALEFGLNLHTGAGTGSGNQRIADILNARNIKHARLDTWNIAQTHDMASKIRAIGGRVQVSAQISFQWDSSCNPNHGLIESNAYNEMTTMIHQLKDVVHDFEYLNEVSLRPEIVKEVPFNRGNSITAYQGKPCVATTMAALRGMSRALRDVRAATGLPLRGIMGAIGRDFGLLEFAAQSGVTWDVTGYHIYPTYSHTSLLINDPWFGPGGGPLVQLAKHGKPVTFNEFNCGEINAPGYENRAGATATERCLRSLARHLKQLRSQGIVNLESIHFYELLDEREKSAPENRFGLMYDLSSPKVHLYVATAFAGGALSAAERSEITRRGLLSDAEIDAMRAAPSPAPNAQTPRVP